MNIEAFFEALTAVMNDSTTPVAVKAAMDNEKTECCNESYETIDGHRASRTGRCVKCKQCFLLKGREDEESGEVSLLHVPLPFFDERRYTDRQPQPDSPWSRRPLDDMSLSEHVWRASVLDLPPPPPASADFGVRSSLQLAVFYDGINHGGLMPYDLDRVLGWGPAVTRLMNWAAGRTGDEVQFVTDYDDLIVRAPKGNAEEAH